MIFVDQKEIISVIETAKKEILTHPNFDRHILDNYNTSFTYKMSLPDDKKKKILMEVMFFHFPK